MMMHIPEVLTREQLASMRAALGAANWTDGRATVGPQGAQVKQNRQLPETSALAAELGAVILAALKRNPMYISAALPLRTVPPLFNSYEGGEHYGAHVDGSIREVPGGLAPLRTDLSCTLFLADPDDYDGGELVVLDTYGTHEVKLPAGDMILYPSSSVHKVEPVTRGARVCSFFWVQSMVRDDAKRLQLLDLDQTIQRLRMRVGDCDEVVALTSHYHNLLRMWAEL
jgi:PKHD-type hydroxylase